MSLLFYEISVSFVFFSGGNAAPDVALGLVLLQHRLGLKAAERTVARFSMMYWASCRARSSIFPFTRNTPPMRLFWQRYM